MEEPSSPMRPHFLSRRIHPNPNLPSNAEAEAALSPSASPFYPDDCLLPNNDNANALSSDRQQHWVPKPRHGNDFLLPSSFSSLKENEPGNERYNHPPPPNFGSQPITPSPKSSTNLLLLHDNCSGLNVPCVSLEETCGLNEFESEGRRIGYDGTNRTPSIQLIKPTASSLGHIVHKAVAVRSQQALSPMNSMHDNPYCMDSPNSSPYEEDYISNSAHCFDHHKERGDHMTVMAFNPLPSPMDPFGKLNNSNILNITASDDDEMEDKTDNNSSLLDGYNAIPEGRMNYHPPERGDLSKPVLQRCSSWSPGYGNNRGFNKSERSCPERLRSYNIDPVASQLLRECAVHEEDPGEGEQELDPLSMSNHAIGRMSGWEGAAGSCHSPTPRSNDANFLFSSSMPDLLSPIPSAMANEQGGRNEDIPEEASIDYPLSPIPLFRNVSGSLRDVHTEDDIKSLARPVARKFSMPGIASSPRRCSFPAKFW